MTEDIHSSSDSNFSIASMKKIIKSTTDKRVTKDSANELGVLSEEFGQEIAEKAIEIAEEEDRETVRRTDIKTALRQKRRNE